MASDETAIGVGLFRIPLVTAVAVAGSLAVGVLLRLTPLTDALFLGGRYRAPGAQAPMR